MDATTVRLGRFEAVITRDAHDLAVVVFETFKTPRLSAPQFRCVRVAHLPRGATQRDVESLLRACA